MRAQLRRPAGDRHAGDGHLRKKIIDALPYALTVLLLAIFLGFEVIGRVSPTLHTPLMSATNAISGISLAVTQPIRVGDLIAIGDLVTMVEEIAGVHLTRSFDLDAPKGDAPKPEKATRG